ncbi:outer dynein arm-docking complex subunit 4 isoform X6 [Phyllopteryx taeniolatus]|uniref:outer dynein arm-docking complex subunit 4 isoform X6 n=1 Tax=Phyllopteryx taeniolatus TaxID=161469 RepID=UPI002AD3A438|nr:outer dynein arm-docking complex subunit 4 isoform X6 [Phyllopteryx taeniolatus]
MSETESECKTVKAKGVFSTSMAEGDWLLLRGQCEKAAESYSTALTLKPKDKYCFVGRSKCYLRMGQYEKALRDAEASLQEDESFFKGLYQKAEALYCMGEFEFALVFYHRGLKLRPQVQDFQLGIQKAQEAIENVITVPAAVRQRHKGDTLQKDEQMTTYKKPQASETEKKSKKFLGEFYEDRKYLENLLKDEALVKSRTRNGEQLQDLIQGCLTYLDYCADFWNQQKPPRPPPKDPRRQRSKRGKAPARAPSEPAHFLLKSLEDIDADLASGKSNSSSKKAQGVLQMVQGWSEKDVPDEKHDLGSTHSFTGNALVDLGEMDKAREYHLKDLDLAEKW